MLETGEVGPDDDFFALGGDSILSIVVSGRAHRAGLAVGPQDVFEHPTPAALAAAAGEIAGGTAPGGGPDGGSGDRPDALLPLTAAELEQVARVAPVPVEEVWPLSPLQEGLYFHSSYDTGTLDVYIAQVAFDFTERVDAGRLRDACAAVLARHTALRAGFTGDGLPRPVQFIGADPRPRLEVIDLSGLIRPAGRRRSSGSWRPTAGGGSTCPRRRCSGCC